MNNNLKNKALNIIEKFGKEEAELEDSVYECLFQMKRTIFGNECFIVLNNQMLRERVLPEKDITCHKILPIFRLKNGMIDKKSLELLQ